MAPLVKKQCYFSPSSVDHIIPLQRATHIRTHTHTYPNTVRVMCMHSVIYLYYDIENIDTYIYIYRHILYIIFRRKVT